MAESDDGEIGRNGEGENLKLRNSDCGIQRVRRGDKGIRISGHQEKSRGYKRRNLDIMFWNF
jgi:hypothetical protein